MPAVTPADVHTLPSRTKIGSGSTVDVRDSVARARSHARQCVVARRPSSSPAAASTNAPVHTDATRRLRARGARDRSATSAASLRRVERAFAADDDQRVDRTAQRAQRPVGDDRRPAAGRDRPRGSVVDRAVRSRPIVDVVPAPAAANTSCGPTRSSAVMPGIGDEDDAAAHPPIVRAAGAGSNDQIRTIPATSRPAARSAAYDPRAEPMDLTFSPAEEQFRAECRAWLEANVPRPALPSGDTREGFAAHLEWERTLFDARYAVVSWPAEYGGREAQRSGSG